MTPRAPSCGGIADPDQGRHSAAGRRGVRGSTGHGAPLGDPARRYGVAGLLPETKGPKRKSKLTANVVAKIQRLRQDGPLTARSSRRLGCRTAVSAMPSHLPMLAETSPAHQPVPAPHLRRSRIRRPTRRTRRPAGAEARNEEGAQDRSAVAVPAAMAAGLPVLAGPPDRSGERVLARFGMIPAAPPVFTGCAHAPLAGLFLAAGAGRDRSD